MTAHNPGSYLSKAAAAGADATLATAKGISAEGTLDAGELDAATIDIANDDLVIGDHNDSHLAKKSGFAAAITAVAGVAATTGLVASAGGLTVAAKIAHVEAALAKGTRDVRMSFETDEKTTTRIYFPMKVTVNKLRGIVMKAIAASNNGTITCGNSDGASTGGVITATASDALNVAYSVSPTTNNVVSADSYYYLTSAKSTAGGIVLVTLEYTVTA
jgi:hypothetical protein